MKVKANPSAVETKERKSRIKREDFATWADWCDDNIRRRTEALEELKSQIRDWTLRREHGEDYVPPQRKAKKAKRLLEALAKLRAELAEEGVEI